ncbi:hypothetical protein [Janibacter hoylei]|uniref:hypothetical protein n=1 Tax=Janibacter hoylei TaxID=364298 RepID=UPI0021A47231|nr:hypothetical protein [Janibacter hoylei]MCT1618853.1 hypothetical protein [Janibacter hoylei]MCT2292741.1 hypothetical protein [Janibacter hoylei]
MAMTVRLCIGMMALVTMTTVTGCSSTPEPESGEAVDARLADLVRDGTSAPLGEVVEGHWDRAAFFHEGVTAERVNSVVGSEAISDRWTASPALLVAGAARRRRRGRRRQGGASADPGPGQRRHGPGLLPRCDGVGVDRHRDAHGAMSTAIRRIGLMLVLGLVVVLGSACGASSDDDRHVADKHVDERGTRSDVEPLTQRFPDLGDPVSATWQSGTLGDSRTAPGPSTYWIDAAVTVEPEVADSLRAQPSPDGDRPMHLVDAVGDELGDGTFDEVALAGPDTWQVDAWVAADRDVVVISARGQ